MRSTQSTPFSTSRGSRQGRPPLEPVLLRSGPGKEARMASHCSSVRSITTVDHECDLPSIPPAEPDRIPRPCARPGCEMRSSLFWPKTIPRSLTHFASSPPRRRILSPGARPRSRSASLSATSGSAIPELPATSLSRCHFQPRLSKHVAQQGRRMASSRSWATSSARTASGVRFRRFGPTRPRWRAVGGA